MKLSSDDELKKNDIHKGPMQMSPYHLICQMITSLRRHGFSSEVDHFAVANALPRPRQPASSSPASKFYEPAYIIALSYWGLMLKYSKIENLN